MVAAAILAFVKFLESPTWMEGDVPIGLYFLLFLPMCFVGGIIHVLASLNNNSGFMKLGVDLILVGIIMLVLALAGKLLNGLGMIIACLFVFPLAWIILGLIKTWQKMRGWAETSSR